MYVISLGKVTVTTATTIVRLSTILAALSLAADLKVHKLEFWPTLGNTGAVHVGIDASAPAAGGVPMLVSSGLNVIKSIQKPSTTGQQDQLTIQGEGMSVRVADYAVDATTNGDSFQVFATVL